MAESPFEGGNNSRRCRGNTAPGARPERSRNRRSPHAFLHAGRGGARGRRRLLRGPRRRDPRGGRRKRLRQERHRPVGAAARRDAARADRRRRHPLRRPQPARTRRKRDGGDPRQRDLDDIPGADDFAEPAADLRAADRRGDRAAPGPAAAGGGGASGRDAAPRLDPRGGAPGPRLPAPALGGMRQRVMIAMALSCNPKVLIADEPTTALDVTIQAQILHLMQELKDKLGTAIILITHDMGVVAENADRVVVMYAGRKVEEASAKVLFEAPGHPYTRGLLGSIPKLDVAARLDARRNRLTEIKGMVPSLRDLPEGCTFAPRCDFATDRCRAAYPPLVEHRPGHTIACWHAEKLLAGAA